MLMSWSLELALLDWALPNASSNWYCSFALIPYARLKDTEPGILDDR